MLFRYIKCYLILILVSGWCGGNRPGRLFREEWGNRLMFRHLINMTQNMCKDALYKLRMADKIQEEYKNSLAYELGLLAAGIMDKFKHMLRVYRYYSNHQKFKRHTHSVDEIMNGYSVMQSDYNEIRAERDLYIDVLDQFKRKRAEEDRMIESYAAKNPGLSAQAIKDARDRGMKPPNRKNRRTMDTFNITTISRESILEMAKRDGFKIDPPKKAKKNSTEWAMNHSKEEAEYKKKLRYIMWAERWKGFNPETEGVNIPDQIARVGLANESNFLLKELKGIV